MKKIFFTLIMCTFFGGLAVAQCTGHAKVTKTEKSCHSEKASAEAMKAAANFEDVEQRTCEKSGKVSFVRTSLDETSGETTEIPVVYNQKSETFESRDQAKADKKGCCASKASAKAGCAKKAKSTESKQQEAKPTKKSEPSKI